MPIDFQPPQANINYQIPPPQSTDPLQTLAQMGQLRTQGLQQQSAQMGLEQQRMQLNSSKAMMNQMVQAGGDYNKFFDQAGKDPNILPSDLIAARQHITQMQQEAATLEKTKRENQAAGIERYRGVLGNVQSQQDLDAANAQAEQLGVGRDIPRITQFTDPAHVQAFSNGLATQGQVLKEATERETAAKEKAGTALAGLQTTAEQQKIDAAEKAAIAQEIQAAPVDPTTQTPTPAAMAEIQARHPKVQLPPPTKDAVDRFVRSIVPPEKQPEFDLNTMKAKMGLMGNTEFDQYLLKAAQGIGKTPATMSAPEFNTALQKYATLKQDPTLLALMIGQKGLAEMMTRAQLASMPTPEGINMFAKMAVNHEMSPDQFNELRSGRTSMAPQIIMRAKQIDPNFNMARLEAEYKAMTGTEGKFANGPEAQMVRSNNNLMEHLGLLDQARKALGSNDIPALRSISQALGIQFGGDAPTSYDLIAKAVADEASKSFVPGSGGESERAARQADFRRQLGDTQISSNIKGLLHIVDSQQRNLVHQYNTGTYGKGTLGNELFTPRAQATRDALLGKAPAATHKVGDPVMYQGKPHTITAIDPKTGKLTLTPTGQ